jgi:hypothetical protein
MHRSVSLVGLGVVTALLALALPSARAEAAPKPTVAIFGLELADDGSGIDERTNNAAQKLVQAMRERARASTSPYSPAPGGDRELVEALVLAGCASSSDKDCIVGIGAGVPTDFLIYGRLEKRGKGFQVSLTLLDIAKKDRVRQLTETIPGNETSKDELAKHGKDLYDKLTGGSAKGTLLVTANVDAGSVFVDGKSAGNLVRAQARIHGLDPGSHRVRIEADDKEPYEADVTIEASEQAELTVTLNAREVVGPAKRRPGGLWRGMFWGSAVVAVGAGAVWGYSYAQYAFLNDPDHSDAFCDDEMVLAMDPELRSSCAALDRTWIVGPITVGAVALAGVSFYLGYIRPGPATRERSVTFAPVIAPDRAGAVLQIQW